MDFSLVLLLNASAPKGMTFWLCRKSNVTFCVTQWRLTFAPTQAWRFIGDTSSWFRPEAKNVRLITWRSQVQILPPQPWRPYQHRYPFGWRFFCCPHTASSRTAARPPTSCTWGSPRVLPGFILIRSIIELRSFIGREGQLWEICIVNSRELWLLLHRC